MGLPLHPTPASLRAFLARHLEGTVGFQQSLELSTAVLRHGAFVGSVIHCHPQLERTMDEARRLISEYERSGRSVPSGAVILADTLTSPKGRFTRSWHAPPGGLWGCLILADTFLPATRNLIPLSLGISCCEAVHEMGVHETRLRWVNDVMLCQRKLAGFLVESHFSPRHGELFHLLGFGININNASFPDELTPTAVSLSQHTGGLVDLSVFAHTFLARLSWNIGLICYEEEQNLHSWHEQDEPPPSLLMQRWKELSDTLGQRVQYGYNIDQEVLYEATVVNIRNDGALAMRLTDGNEVVEQGGEIRYL